MQSIKLSFQPSAESKTTHSLNPRLIISLFDLLFWPAALNGLVAPTGAFPTEIFCMSIRFYACLFFAQANIFGPGTFINGFQP